MNLNFRPLRDNDEQDYAIMTEIINAANDELKLDWHDKIERVRESLTPTPQFDPTQDLRLVELDDRVVAIARTRWADRSSGERIFAMTGTVHPDVWGQRVGRAVLNWSEQRAATVAAQIAVPAKGPQLYHAWCSERNPRFKALLESSGYYVARLSIDMVRPDFADIPDFQLPAHLEIRPVSRENLGLMRAVWEADAEAFADHWGYTAPTEDDYKHWLKDSLTQPQLFKVAFDKATGEVAGMVLNFMNEEENTRLNRKRGYTEGISTRRKYRKQGVARALICESLRMFRDMGMTEAALGADADNLTGAVRVYRTCGFEVVQRTTLYWKKF